MLGRGKGLEIAFVTRLRDVTNDNVVVICAGRDAGATFGTVRYLAEEWRYLHKEYGSDDFSVALAFAQLDPNTKPAVAPQVPFARRLKSSVDHEAARLSGFRKRRAFQLRMQHQTAVD